MEPFEVRFSGSGKLYSYKVGSALRLHDVIHITRLMRGSWKNLGNIFSRTLKARKLVRAGAEKEIHFDNKTALIL